MGKQTVAEGDFQYEAFISYRHTSPDDRIAKVLQSKIENYKIPAPIRKETGRKRMGKVFRDRDELPTSANLGADITAALEGSHWLIVICSPKMPLSKWCMKEVETFIKLGRRDRILTLLVQGEPEQAFPSQLRFVDDGSDGVTEIEPLAADVRAKGPAGMIKKLNTEVLRLLAPMLGVGFDDLKRRSRERAVRRILGISSTATALLAAFSVYAATQALTISRQNEEIFRANKEITKTNVDLKVQIGETQLSQSKFLTSLARAEYARGNELAAVQLALAALPEDFDDPERPVYSDAVAMLRQIELKNNFNTYKPALIIDVNGDFQFHADDIALSPDGQFIGVVGAGSLVQFYSAVDGSKIENDPLNGLYMNSSGAEFIFYPDGTKVLLSEGDLAEFKGGKVSALRRYGGFSLYKYYLSGDGSVMVGAGEEEIGFHDLETLEVLASKEMDDVSIWHISLSHDGDLAACISRLLVKVVKTADFSEVFSAAADTDKGYRYDVLLSPDGQFVAAQHIMEAMYDHETKLSYNRDQIAVYDIKTGEKVLSVNLATTMYKIVAAFSPDSAYLALGKPDGIVEIYDTRTWQLFRSLHGHSAVVNQIKFSPDGTLMITAGEDKKVVIWETADFTPLDQECGENNARSISISNDNTIAINYGGDVKILRKAENSLVIKLPSSKMVLNQTSDVVIGYFPNGSWVAYDRDTMQPLPQVDISEDNAELGHLTLSPDKRSAISTCFSTFSIWDLTAGRKLMDGNSPTVKRTGADGKKFDWPTSLTVIGYSKDGKTIISYLNMLEVAYHYLVSIDAETGEELHRMDLGGIQLGDNRFISIDPTKSMFLLKNDTGIQVFDINTFTLIREIAVDYEDMWVAGIFLSPCEDVALCHLGSDYGFIIKAYDIDNGALLYQSNSTDRFSNILFMSDGRSFLCNNGNQLKLLALYSGKTVRVLVDPRKTDLLFDCDQIILSQDKTMIACREYVNNEIEVWDIETGCIVARVETPFFSNDFGSMHFIKRDTALLVCGMVISNKNACYELRDGKTVAEDARKNLIRELTQEERKRYYID